MKIKDAVFIKKKKKKKKKGILKLKLMQYIYTPVLIIEHSNVYMYS